LLIGALLVSFATFVTSHVAIAVRLLWSVRPWTYGLVALLVPPVAVWQAFVQRWRLMSWLWVGALGVYVVALLLAQW
jgi:hypothetical protein